MRAQVQAWRLTAEIDGRKAYLTATHGVTDHPSRALYWLRRSDAVATARWCAGLRNWTLEPMMLDRDGPTTNLEANK